MQIEQSVSAYFRAAWEEAKRGADKDAIPPAVLLDVAAEQLPGACQPPRQWRGNVSVCQRQAAVLRWLEKEPARALAILARLTEPTN